MIARGHEIPPRPAVPIPKSLGEVPHQFETDAKDPLPANLDARRAGRARSTSGQFRDGVKALAVQFEGCQVLCISQPKFRDGFCAWLLGSFSFSRQIAGLFFLAGAAPDCTRIREILV